MILLWGHGTDRPVADVRRALAQQHADVVFVDQRRLLDATFDVCVSDKFRAVVRYENRTIELGDVRAAYLRPYDSLTLHTTNVAKQRAAADLEVDVAAWANVAEAMVINRPLAAASNASKPYQAGVIAAEYFEVPDTLLTTDAADVATFRETHEQIIYKSSSAIRSVVRRLDSIDTKRLADLATCPVQFQEHIAGRDVRVHVVGDDVFACEVVGEYDDYRYADEEVRIRACELPTDVVERSRQLAVTCGLHVAGIDLRQRADGAWYCFEINPSPAFSAYSVRTGQPIADAIAALLVRGHRERQVSRRNAPTLRSPT